MNVYGTQALRLGMATDTIAATLTGVKAGLTKSLVNASENTLLADLATAHADFTGYAKKSITWNAPSVTDDGQVEVVGTMSEWRPTDSVAPNSVWNIWIEDSTAAILYMVAEFDNAPLPMNSATDAILVTIRWRPFSNQFFVVIS